MASSSAQSVQGIPSVLEPLSNILPQSNALEVTPGLANDLLFDKAKAPATAPSENVRAAIARSKAMEMLNLAMKPYMPLHREPGKWVFQGTDLVVHSEKGKYFNDTGTILMAARTLQSWEKHIGYCMKLNIGRPP